MKFSAWRQVAAGMLLAVSATAFAQKWPEKLVTIVVPQQAGAATDMVGRIFSTQLAAKTGQAFVVENKVGATGTIGTGFVKRAAPDGNTLLVASIAQFAIVPHLMSNVPYDPMKDFDLLTVAVRAPNVLVVPAASPFNTLAELVAFHKANPGKLSFGSSGNGGSDHLTAEMFWTQLGAKGLHVPYTSGAQQVAGVLGNQVDACFQNVNAVLSHIKGGKLKALVVTGDRRSAALPAVPTMAEAGVKDVVVYSWQAVVAPRGVPAATKAQIHKALVDVLHDPAVTKRLEEQGLEVVGNRPEEFEQFLKAENARWKAIIDAGQIKAN